LNPLAAGVDVIDPVDGPDHVGAARWRKREGRARGSGVWVWRPRLKVMNQLPEAERHFSVVGFVVTSLAEVVSELID
jgi:hypothetical protein